MVLKFALYFHILTGMDVDCHKRAETLWQDLYTLVFLLLYLVLL